MGKDLFDFLSGFPFQLTLVCKNIVSTEQQIKAFRKKQKRALKYGLIKQDFFDFRSEQTTISTSLEFLEKCDLIIEAVTEDIHKKRDFFKELRDIINSNCIVTSNTSSIPPDQLFSGILDEKKCLGLHFFYPVSLKNIVEVNRCEMTSEKTLSFVKGFLQKINKPHTVLTGNNHFIVNRIFLKMQAGCCQLLHEDGISRNEIDTLVKAHLFPAGVFEFFDHVGIDVMLQSVKNYIQYENDKAFYKPLINYLESEVEKVSGVTPQGKQEIKERNELLEKISNWYLDGVYNTLENGVCSKTELDHIVKEYMLIEKSPFDLAKEIGYTPK